MKTKLESPLAEWQNGIGYAAKQLCSLVYISELEPEKAKSLYIDPVISHLNVDLSIKYDHPHRRVTVSNLGSLSATAEMREGLGCTLTSSNGSSHLPAIELPTVENKPLERVSQQDLAQNFDKLALDRALERAFIPEHNTLAVLVLHRGMLAAERYAAGIDANTVLPGWSMAKSITATLVGLLVKRGLIDVHQPGIVPEWRGSADGRDSVTLDHLLRMTSGLDLVEDQSGADPNSQMLFVESDAAAFAASRGLKFSPGSHWEYMSGNTILACRAIFEATGGTLGSSQIFYREAFMKPLGAPSFILETDAAGTFIGSSYALATTRDWSKFGQLYLDDGVWESKRLLPEGWREYVTKHTPESGDNSYGAGFWTVEHSALSGLPSDTFYANGFQGQYVIVVPSHSLVVVRLGASHGLDGTWQLLKDLISAVKC